MTGRKRETAAGNAEGKSQFKDWVRQAIRLPGSRM